MWNSNLRTVANRWPGRWQGRGERGETTTSEKGRKKRAFPQRFASLRVVLGWRWGWRGNIGAFLFLRRGGRQKRIRKSAPGLLCTFRSRALTQTDILFSRGTRGNAAAGSYRGQFNFNLDRNRELPLRFAGVLSRGVLARPDFPRLSHVRAIQLSRVTAITTAPDRAGLHQSKVNRWYYCAE